MPKRWPLLFISLGTAAWWLFTCQRSQPARQRSSRSVQLRPKVTLPRQYFAGTNAGSRHSSGFEMTLKLSKVKRNTISLSGGDAHDLNISALTQNEKMCLGVIWCDSVLAMPPLWQMCRCDKADEWQRQNYHHNLGRKSFARFHEYRWMVCHSRMSPCFPTRMIV